MSDVNLKTEGGREYLEIAVQPHPHPISYQGEYHYRSGSTKQVLRGAALNRFLLRKYGRTWDDVPLPGVHLKDLDGRALDGFRRRGARSERLPAEILGESDAAVIEHLQLREADSLKRAAVLLFHPAPHRFSIGAQVRIGAFRGSEVLYQDIVEGDLFTQVERTMDLLYTKYARALISYDGIYRVETFPVPRAAMREAVINAVIHRDYQDSAAVQIRVYHDRIAIWNPAELPPGWTAAPAAGAHPSRPFNPRIAYGFFRAGMIEAWGRGLLRIRDACEAAGVPAPQWEIPVGGGLWLRFPFSREYREAAARTDGPDDGGVHDPQSGFRTSDEGGQAGNRGGQAGDQGGQAGDEGGQAGDQGGQAGDQGGQAGDEGGQAGDQGGQADDEGGQADDQGGQADGREDHAGSVTALAAAELAMLRACLPGPVSGEVLRAAAGYSGRSGQFRTRLHRLLSDRFLVRTAPDKPRSPLQRYGITTRGRAALAEPEVEPGVAPGATPEPEGGGNGSPPATALP